MRVCLMIAVALIAWPAAAAEVTVDAESLAAYVKRCRKPSGAFGPIDQDYTDAAWNYPAVRTLQLLGKPVANPEAILAHGLWTPVGHIGLGHYHFFHQHAIRQALGRPESPRHRKVKVVYQGDKPQYYNSPFGTQADLLYKAPGGTTLDPRDLEAETFSFHNLASLHYLLAGLECSGRSPTDPKPLVEYVLRRQAPNGGFVDLHDGSPTADADATVAHSRHAVESLRILGALGKETSEKVEGFLNACRQSFGGYASKPSHAVTPETADVHDAWSALTAYRTLGKPPREPASARTWINSLHNADGGFGDRLGWRSRLYSTFYAVDALGCLGGKASEQITSRRVVTPEVSQITDPSLRIFQAQFKMPVVTPAELEGLRRRGFNLLALKTDKFEHAEPLLQTIREKALPMDVVLCPEAYPHRYTRPGGVLLDHVGNFTLDPRWTDAQRSIWRKADRIGIERPPWPDYRDKVVRPLAGLGSLAYPEQDYDLETAYGAYGDDLSGRKGYNAVLAGFNWAPYDFVRVFPWRERYTSVLTPVADVDAHADLTKWTGHLDRTRTLFIAKGPTYADFQAAATAGRVVTVIAPAEGIASEPAYYGPAAAVAHVRDRRKDWQWWK